MKGGPRGRSGPAPDPNALHRDRDEGAWTLLPAAGRAGEIPAWPLDEVTQRELNLWADEWKRPQAIIWDRNGQQIEVALYVRALVSAERHDAPVAARTLVKQLQEALGISVPGLLRNKWKIEEEVGEDRDSGSSGGEGGTPPARERFRVVAGGGS